ncbi:NAD(P)-binding domain-containing protein [Microbacterium kribbense]|uniref:NAD(P)-binding domain-containing protein n=1 Tax=Microbacterium kribbense TaxID=433645 RepID=A0ABP7GG70_9MICO
MSSISIIGSGNMARAIGARALETGSTVEILARNVGKAAATARALGNGATTGTWGARPTGDIVILAVLHAAAVSVVREFGQSLADKIVVDITNPFNADATGLAIPYDTSSAQLVADVAPAGAHVLKAFNTLFAHIVAAGDPVDVFMAGDDTRAKESLAAFITSLGLRPRDAGDLIMAHWLEGAAVLEMGVARAGAGFDFSLGVNSRVGVGAY